MLISLDIETSCAVSTCKGFGTAKKCDHALSMHHNNISLIGVYYELGENEKSHVFRDVKAFSQWVDSLPSTAVFLGQNLKFDLKSLYAKGVKIPLEKYAHDTLLMATALTHKIDESWLENYEQQRQALNKRLKKNVHRQAGQYSLKTLAPYFADIKPFWETEDMNNEEYVIADARATYKLYHALAPMLTFEGTWDFYENKLLPWNKFLFNMEMRGLPIDPAELDRIEQETREEIVQLKSKLDTIWAPAYAEYRRLEERKINAKYIEKATLAIEKLKDKTEEKIDKVRARYAHMYEKAATKLPETMNLDSPAQLNWLLKEYLKYDISNAEGDETTGKSTLEKLILEGKEDIALFSEYRKKTKLITSFIESYRDLIVDGRIYTSFNLAGTKTGRLSSSYINCQQIPPALKSAFRPPKGYKIFSYDLSGIEPAVIAFFSEDPVLCQTLIQGLNFHDQVTKSIVEYVNCDITEVKKKYPKERNLCKTLDLSWFYGSGLNRTMVTVNMHKFNWSERDCKHKLDKFKRTFRGVFEFKKELENILLDGSVAGLMGRHWKIDDPNDLYMHSLNGLVQGSASDLLLNSAYLMDQDFASQGIDAGCTAIIHDQVVGICHEKDIERAKAIILQRMTDYNLNTIHGRVPIMVEGEFSDVWEK